MDATSTNASPAIRRDDGPMGGRYELGEGPDPSFLTYRWVDDKAGRVMRLESTFTPPSQRGQGHASQLVARAMNDARAAGVKVDPICSYVETWLRRHPDEQDLVA